MLPLFFCVIFIFRIRFQRHPAARQHSRGRPHGPASELLGRRRVPRNRDDAAQRFRRLRKAENEVRFFLIWSIIIGETNRSH